MNLSRKLLMDTAHNSYLQGDEEIIEKLLEFLRAKFPRLKFKSKVPLRELFAEPESKWLKSIWRFGHGDIVVYRHGKPVCIIEPGGFYHTKDETQKLRDKKKDKLCKLNGVNVLRIYNNTVYRFCNPKVPPYNGKQIFKRLLRRYFYSEIK